MKALSPMISDKCGPAEDKEKQFDHMRTPRERAIKALRRPVEQIKLATLQAERLAKIDFQEILGDRESASEIEPPPAPIGEHAPAEPSIGDVVDASQVPQHLGRGDILSALDGVSP
jgi:hypothetical protein